MPGHKTVPVSVGDMYAQIDKKIAALIRELWKADIMTLNSCQENRPGIIWIEFSSSADAAFFLNIVGVYEPGHNTLYNRIHNKWDSLKETIEFWEYDFYLEDLAITETRKEGDCVSEEHHGQSDFTFSLSIRFPCTDYDVVLQRMIEHNIKSQLIDWSCIN